MSNEEAQSVEIQTNNVGTAGFIVALLTLFLGWIPVLGWIMWLSGLILSAMGISRAGSTKKGMGLSVAGLIISLLGIIIIVVLAGSILALMGAAAM